MKKSISNIAWDAQSDEVMYEYLHRVGYDALEIAPTRLCQDNPYDNIEISLEKVKYIKEYFNLEISSMQSIWFGRSERIFGNKNERDILIEYTKKAINYAKKIDCSNLVFGSPKNRIIDNQDQRNIALEFFYSLGEIAKDNDTVISFEPNPVIYNTNFINNTEEAFQLVKEINSDGFRVNLDLGTVIWNREDIKLIMNDIQLINHIHISEPYLEKIEIKDIHYELSNALLNYGYEKYISIEMKDCGNIEEVKKIIKNVSGVIR